MTLSLKGKLLIAMPGLTESTFAGSVIFLCAHSPEGAMGLIINKPMAGASFMELAERLDMTKTTEVIAQRLRETPILMGGPVEQHRGFVLHSTDYVGGETSLEVSDDFKLTATVDVLQDMAEGKGPRQSLIALGYAGWSPGQLENELMHNGWLHGDADADLLFTPDWPQKHTRALQRMGIDPRMLSSSAGHA
jgi:putative transcriptional regulator